MSAATFSEAEADLISLSLSMAASIVASAAVGGASGSAAAAAPLGAGAAGSCASAQRGTARAIPRVAVIRFLGMVGLSGFFVEEG